MTAPEIKGPEIKGWCPGALRPMLSGDGWVVRVRPPLGRLTPVQAQGIAALAQRHGNGLIDLSARANLQLRGITEARHPDLIAGLDALGLIDPDAETEARRNVVVTPFWQDGDASHRIAADLSRLLAAPDAPDLPGKFGFAVDAGTTPALRGVAADIVIESGGDGVLVRPAGTDLARPVSVAEAAEAAMDLARWFVASGGAPGGRGRMARHLASGATLPEGFSEAPAFAGATVAIGPHPAGWLAALAFGQCGAATLAALSRLGPLRLTPWRMVLVEGLTTSPDIPGLIDDPADPLLRVTACTGAPGCPQALDDTRTLARALAPQLAPGTTLHLSGCAKGCAHPGPAPLTLVAQGAGRYGLILNGTAADPPARPVAASTLPSFLRDLHPHAPHL